MKISDAGHALTQGFEQCRLTAYWDALGKVWTVGWGATGKDICQWTVWTQEQADMEYMARRSGDEASVNRHVTVSISQGQFDALCDFVYNDGDGAFEESTLLRLLNDGQIMAAAAEFIKWDHSGGVVVPGLLRRRIAERDMFLSS